MGHHKSQSRASKEGASEVTSNHRKDKYNPHDCDSRADGRSRREKRSHKSKRNDASKRRHRESKRESYRSSKSSSKEKPREKVHRRKDGEGGSESDSSRSFLSGQRGSISHRCDADVPQKRARSADTASHKADHKEHSSKRVKLSKENHSLDGRRENCNGLIQTSRDGGVVHKHSELGKEGHSGAVVSSSKSARSERDVKFTKGQDQEMGFEGRKDRVLEVELRQKALENFMRRQDGSWRTDPHGPLSDVEIRQLATYGEQDGGVLGKEGNRHERAVDNAINLDRHEEPHQQPCTSNTIPLIGCNCPAEENDNNLEEGEIKSDDGTEHESASFVKEKVLHQDKEKKHALRDDCEKQDDLRIISGREIEKAGVSPAAPCVKSKQELSQEHAVQDGPGVDLGSAQHDSSDNFQEKTMSVMRGGEVVQVSYKVYIPKRAAELARRRLQR